MILSSEKGTYALILKANAKFHCQIGKLGTMTGEAGNYIYVGSAFGSGGIAARLKHHLAIAKKPHWHLDYLRPHLQPGEVWISVSSERLEHRWAEMILDLPGAVIPLNTFGSSDCRCKSHLFYFSKTPTFSDFSSKLRKALQQGNRRLIEIRRQIL